MVIVGIMIGASTIMLKRDHQDLLEQDLDRMRALIALARDEAVFQAQSLGIYFTEESYVFMSGVDGRDIWRTMEEKQFRKRKLSNGVKLVLLRNNTRISLLDQAESKPQIFLLSTGEVTPFTVQLTYPAKAKLEMHVDALGQTEVITNEIF